MYCCWIRLIRWELWKNSIGNSRKSNILLKRKRKQKLSLILFTVMLSQTYWTASRETRDKYSQGSGTRSIAGKWWGQYKPGEMHWSLWRIWGIHLHPFASAEWILTKILQRRNILENYEVLNFFCILFFKISLPKYREKIIKSPNV